MAVSSSERSGTDKKDNWSSEAYSGAASFVPQLTSKVLQYLDPQAHDRILSIGCGDGVLEAKMAPLCQQVIGLDASANMVKTAIETVKPQHANTEFAILDCRRLSLGAHEADSVEIVQALQAGSYDKVFSNAALHWILRDESDRGPFFSNVHELLKPGGKLVFEMGGHQNVAEAHVALMSVLRFKYNVPLEDIKARDPWFFPSEELAQQLLEKAGFEVELVESVYRPTRLTDRTAGGKGGLEGWVRLMGANFLETLDAKDIDGAIASICDVLEPTVTRSEDGSQWLGYVRLRAVARKRG